MVKFINSQQHISLDIKFKLGHCQWQTHGYQCQLGTTCTAIKDSPCAKSARPMICGINKIMFKGSTTPNIDLCNFLREAYEKLMVITFSNLSAGTYNFQDGDLCATQTKQGEVSKSSVTHIVEVTLRTILKASS